MSLINKTNVKRYALEISRVSRGGKFTRVSGEFLIHIEAVVKEKIRVYVASLPSVGKTIK